MRVVVTDYSFPDLAIEEAIVTRAGATLVGAQAKDVAALAAAVADADAVTLLIAAATNFVSYKDVGADPRARVEGAMAAAAGVVLLVRAVQAADGSRVQAREVA